MESDNIDMSTSSGGPSGSRWNPTKEQIDLLENLYKQGIRTPSAEQIQQITSKLRAFGHIEGKNVFYWFQNHKARQRQKQKQENIAHFNRFLHRAPPPYPTWPNACRPYYVPPSDLGGYRPHYPKVLLPGCYKRRPTMAENTKSWNGAVQDPRYQEHNIMMPSSYVNEEFINAKHFNQETLDLFPVHPTGNLQAKRAASFSVASPWGETSAAAAAAASTSSDDNHMIEKGNSGEHQFIDFFCGNGPSCDSH